MSWSAGASGIIFERKGNTYYALTAYHVIHNGDSGYFRIRTSKTPSRGNYGTDKDREYYATMPVAKVEFENEAADLAVLSFESEDELKSAKISANLVNKVVKHSVYTTEGSSGAAVLNKNMEICGINIGGSNDVFGRFKHSVMIPADQIAQTIDMWRNGKE